VLAQPLFACEYFATIPHPINPVAMNIAVPMLRIFMLPSFNLFFINKKLNKILVYKLLTSENTKNIRFLK
jgi:hypothetical protein